MFVVAEQVLKTFGKTARVSDSQHAGEGRSLATCAVASVRNLTLADHVSI